MTSSRLPACATGRCRSRSCARRVRRRPTSRPGCAKHTCATTCPGPAWRCSSGRRVHCLPLLRRALAAAGVPHAVATDELPLVDHPAVATVAARAAMRGAARRPSTRMRPPRCSRHRSAAPTSLRCVGCDARCGKSSWPPAGGERPMRCSSTFRWPRELVALDRPACRAGPRGGPAARGGADGGRRAGRDGRDGPVGGLGGQRPVPPVAVARRSRRHDRRNADRDLDGVVALFEAVAGSSTGCPGPASRCSSTSSSTRSCPPSRWPRVRPTVTRSAAHRARGQGARVGRRRGGGGPGGRLAGPAGCAVLPRQRTARRARRPRARAPRSRQRRVASLSRLLDEERRLFYVAVTRARSAVLVTAVASEREALGAVAVPRRDRPAVPGADEPTPGSAS